MLTTRPPKPPDASGKTYRLKTFEKRALGEKLRPNKEKICKRLGKIRDRGA
jgi:hypothetical protein